MMTGVDEGTAFRDSCSTLGCDNGITLFVEILLTTGCLIEWDACAGPNLLTIGVDEWKLAVKSYKHCIIAALLRHGGEYYVHKSTFAHPAGVQDSLWWFAKYHPRIIGKAYRSDIWWLLSNIEFVTTLSCRSMRRCGREFIFRQHAGLRNINGMDRDGLLD